ncbi:MAG: C-GCAxxG-C-C family protein [Anaerolineales bacterium]|nr:C-GCAxxG-C-C family protein [Anaerolineales bacterium]
MLGQSIASPNNDIPKKAYDLAYEYESKYGVCSQCVVLAVMEAMGEVDSESFKAAFGFGGGIGNLSHTCGALSGGVMMISLAYGRELKNLATQTKEEKLKCHKMVRDLYTRFVHEYGSSECADVHMRLFGRTFNQWDDGDFQEFLRLGGHVDKCTRVAGNVARWTSEIIINNRISP